MLTPSASLQLLTVQNLMFSKKSGNDERPGSRGFKKLSEFGSSALQGHGRFQKNILLFFGAISGAEDP